MKNFIALALIGIGLSGCTSTSTNTDYNSYHSAKELSKPRLMARMLGGASHDVEIGNVQFRSQGYGEYSKDYFRRIGSTPFGGASVEVPRIDMKSVVTDESLLLDLQVHNVKPILYRKGEFLLDPITGTLDPSTTVFIDTVKRIVTRFDTEIKNSGFDMIINAVYTGGADRSQILRPIPFSNEIGSINESVLVNGKHVNVNIKNGGFIRTNTELAAVRAVAVSKAVDFNVSPIKLKNSFKVELSDRNGDEYRFVKLTLRIVEAKK